jgi:hypothetical protein
MFPEKLHMIVTFFWRIFQTLIFEKVKKIKKSVFLWLIDNLILISLQHKYIKHYN